MAKVKTNTLQASDIRFSNKYFSGKAEIQSVISSSNDNQNKTSNNTDNAYLKTNQRRIIKYTTKEKKGMIEASRVFK